MTPTARRFGIIGIALAGFLVLVATALPYLVSLDSLRARVAAAAETSLHRQVEIGRMRLQIFSGLGAGVERVVVRNKPGFESPALLSADRVSIKVAFWPLLSRRLEVRRLELGGVSLTVERNAAGASNVDDFLSAGRRESAPASATAAAALLVSRIDVTRGRVSFLDRKASAGPAATIALDDITARLTDLGPATAARFEVSARFLADAGHNVSLKGTLGPPPASGPVGESELAAAFSAKGLALGRLAPWVGAFRENDPGGLSVEGKASGQVLGALAVSGRIALEPPASAKMPAVDGTVAATLDWPKGTLVVAKSLFDVAELALSVEGRVDDFQQTPRVELRVATPGEVGLEHVTGFPGVAGRFPAGFQLAGRIRMDLQLSGPASDLAVRGSADAAPLGVSMNGQSLLDAPSVHATLETAGRSPLAGRVDAPSGKLKNVAFQNLRADWTWNAGALTLSPTAEVFGGTLGGRIESDFAHPASESRVALDVRGVQAQPLVESATTRRNVVAGTLDGKIALTSRGLGWEAISKTGRGQGRVSLTDADLRTVQLMPEVARSLSAVGQVAGFQVPPSLESTRFSRLETSLTLADGRITTPDLELSGPDVAAEANGSIGLDRTLSYQGRIVLGPSVVRSLGTAGRYVSDAAGRISLPFRATGALDAPRVSIEESVVLELGRHALARQAQERVGGTAGKVLGQVLDGGTGKSASPLDVLQRLLAAPAPTPTVRPR